MTKLKQVLYFHFVFLYKKHKNILYEEKGMESKRKNCLFEKIREEFIKARVNKLVLSTLIRGCYSVIVGCFGGQITQRGKCLSKGTGEILILFTI